MVVLDTSTYRVASALTANNRYVLSEDDLLLYRSCVSAKQNTGEPDAPTANGFSRHANCFFGVRAVFLAVMAATFTFVPHFDNNVGMPPDAHIWCHL